ncbi:MAG: OmpA family protein [Spirochaetaceae bacterium]|jgi:outer membrane protein OmpA-like peptidoglycan-associated protein|nr:OmpA family protein [Spirochaetaceae bacterium]
MKPRKYPRLFFVRLILAASLLILNIRAGFCDEFAFKHAAGDKFKIVSEVHEEYLQNGKVLDRSNIHNRISTEVTGIIAGKAAHKALFQVMVDKTAAEGGKTMNITNEYASQFERDELGKMQVSRKFAFPSVRNVPVFPRRNIKSGDTWFEDGEEVHDLEGNFGLKDFLRLPFRAKYQYLGQRQWRGKMYPAFLVTYSIRQNYDDYFEKNPRQYLSPNAQDPKNKEPKTLVIVSVSGNTSQTVFWNSALGQPAASKGAFTLRFTMSDGTVHEFRSEEEAEILYSEEMNKDAVAAEVEKELRDAGVNETSVRKVEGGVSITLENIQFEGDSAVLRQSEKAKLDKIAQALARYSGRDILVAGHTADAGGTAESRLKLSGDRAGAVAGYLTQKKARPEGQIMTKGYGATVPIASNDTQEGRAKNRRVEIIILEN